jgi:MFS family permease
MVNHNIPLPPGVREPRFFYGYIIVIASFLLLLIVFGARYSFGIFFKPLLNQFGWTRAVTTGAYTLNAALAGVSGIFIGKLGDRFGSRVVITFSGLLLGLGYLLMSQISAIWQIYLLFGVLISIGMAGMWVSLMSTVARWFVKKRGLATGITVSGVGVGTIIMPPLANYLIASYGWRTSYTIIGLIVLIVTIIVAQFLRRDPSQMGLLAYGTDAIKTDSPILDIQGFSFMEAIRTRQFWIICSMFFCAGFCMQTVMVHIAAFATDIWISTASAATILSAVGLVSIGSKIGAGSIGDRIGSRRVMIIDFVLISLSFLWLLLANELWMLYLFAVIFGLGYGAFAALESPIVAEKFGLRAHGAIFGLTTFGSFLGDAIGPLVAGSIFDTTGTYTWAFILCAILGIVGLILSTLLNASHN